MIKVKHPLEQCNKMQEEMLANTPASEKAFNELLFSYGNAAYQYHYNARDFKPTVEDYMEWLSGLEPGIKKGMEEKGFDGCLGVLSFTRYVNEKNEIGMDEYIKRLMGENESNSYRELLVKRRED